MNIEVEKQESSSAPGGIVQDGLCRPPLPHGGPICLTLSLAATGLNRPDDLSDARFPRPVALGAVQWDAEAVSGEYFGLIRQENVSMSAAAAKAHGLTDRFTRARGLPERTVLSWLTNTLRSSTHVIGWNLTFELAVIRAALIRHGGDPDSLLRPGLVLVDLQSACTPLVGPGGGAFGDGTGQPPTLEATLDALIPEADPAPDTERFSETNSNPQGSQARPGAAHCCAPRPEASLKGETAARTKSSNPQGSQARPGVAHVCAPRPEASPKGETAARTNILFRAQSCRALFTALCANNLLPDMEAAA